MVHDCKSKGGREGIGREGRGRRWEGGGEVR